MVGIINLTDDSRFNYNQKGFTSIINGLIEICLFHYNKYKNFNIYVSDPRVELFYDLPKNDLLTQSSYYVSSEYLEMLFKLDFPDYNAHNIVKESDIEIRNFIFNNVFKLKSNLDFNNDLFDIGVHIRGTDKKTEITEMSVDNIINKINSISEKSIQKLKLFISTDEFKYIEEIKVKVKNVDIFYFNDNVISYDGNPIHFVDNRDLIDFQVLRDVYTLKKSNTLFYCYSNVSLMTIMIGYNTFKEKIILN